MLSAELLVSQFSCMQSPVADSGSAEQGPSTSSVLCVATQSVVMTTLAKQTGYCSSEPARLPCAMFEADIT